MTAPSQPEFMRVQYALAAHIRDPQRHAPPADVEERRLAVYRELLYNNVASFMADSFPVLRRITPDARWHALLRDYFAHHVAHTPLFPEMPTEFLRYLEGERRPQPDDPPFLAELAHYEWVELALSIAEAREAPREVMPDGDLLEAVPVLSPLAWPLSYRFPVHRIGPDFLPTEPSATPTHLLVYRDAQDAVHFMELNPTVARLLELMSGDEAASGRALLQRIAAELNHPQTEVVLEGGRRILEDLQARGVVLGAAALR